MGFLLAEAMNLQSFQTMENNISEVLCSSRQQYRDYNIGLYGVKHCTVSNSKCAMPSLLVSLLLYYPYNYFSFFNLKIFLFSSLPILYMHAYIKYSGFIGGKGPRSLKMSFCHIKGKV